LELVILILYIVPGIVIKLIPLVPVKKLLVLSPKKLVILVFTTPPSVSKNTRLPLPVNLNQC
jgi:hypothetical protein